MMRTPRKARAHVECTIKFASSLVLKSVYGVEQYTDKEKGFEFFQSMFRAITSRALVTATEIRALYILQSRRVKDCTGYIKLMTI